MNIFLLVLGGLNFILLVWIAWRMSQNSASPVLSKFDEIHKSHERLERLFREEMAQSRAEAGKASHQGRGELRECLDGFSHNLMNRMSEVANLHKNQLDTFSNELSRMTKLNEEKLEKMRLVVEQQLKSLQEDNGQRLERMRETVDEKLHATLERRLGDSFKIVSERLEKVHQGLGEMQNLASGVGDLKKVLTNIKTRGTWGEIQLENLLEQILTPDQYEKGVVTKKNSRDPVDFAIRLPGKTGTVYIPIDAKFPIEDYERLIHAQEACDVAQVLQSEKAIETRIKLEAKKIRDKYLDPPQTTDFAVLYLITEGLYAEVLRRPGLSEFLQREYRIIIAGPTTLAALLNSLQMGFRTLAVEQRASEVWEVLGTVKTEFHKFGDILDKTHKKLQEASNSIERAASKSRNIEKKLGRVQELPSGVVAEEAISQLTQPLVVDDEI